MHPQGFPVPAQARLVLPEPEDPCLLPTLTPLVHPFSSCPSSPGLLTLPHLPSNASSSPVIYFFPSPMGPVRSCEFRLSGQQAPADPPQLHPGACVRSPVSFHGPEGCSSLQPEKSCHQAAGPKPHMLVRERFPGVGRGVCQGFAIIGKVLEKRPHLSGQMRVKPASERGRWGWVTSGVPSQSLRTEISPALLMNESARHFQEQENQSARQ